MVSKDIPAQSADREAHSWTDPARPAAHRGLAARSRWHARGSRLLADRDTEIWVSPSTAARYSVGDARGGGARLNRESRQRSLPGLGRYRMSSPYRGVLAVRSNRAGRIGAAHSTSLAAHDVSLLEHLYLCAGLLVNRITQPIDLGRWRVTRLLRRADRPRRPGGAYWIQPNAATGPGLSRPSSWSHTEKIPVPSATANRNFQR